MRRGDPRQLALDFDQGAAARPALFVPTRVLRNHRQCNSVMKRVHYVRRFFPEFGDRPIRVGVTRAASGMAVPGGDEVWFNPTLLSYHTIAHEFTHLLQGEYGIPTGERSCDLYSLARHWTLNDTAPYYVRIPNALLDRWGKIQPASARLIYRVAVAALELRQAGKRNYIAYFEKTLREAEIQSRGPKGIGLLEPELQF